MRKRVPAALLFVIAATLLFCRAGILEGRLIFPSDFVRQRAPFAATPAEPPAYSRRRAMGDVAQEMAPWQIFTREQWRAGRVPLWLPAQAGGSPLAANDQSAVFFPGSLLAALFPAKAQLTILALVRILVAMGGMLLLARQWRLEAPAAAAGAVAYGFSWMTMFWLGWPQTSVAAALPWLVLAVERLRVAESAGARRRGAGLVAASVAFAFLGGHTETVAQVLFVAALYLAGALAFEPAAPGRRRRGAIITILLAGGVVLGTLVAAVHLVPFLELLPRTTAWHEHTTADSAIPFGDIREWFAPDAFGYLSWLARPDSSPAPALENAVRLPLCGYAGLSTLVLAVAAFFDRSRRDVVRSLAVVVVVLTAIIYGVGLDRLFTLLPLLGRTGFNRMLFAIAFAQAALAAIGVQAIADRVGTLRASLVACGAVVALSAISLATADCPYGFSRGAIPIAAALATGGVIFLLSRAADERARLVWLLPIVVAAEVLLVDAPIPRWALPADALPIHDASTTMLVDDPNGLFAAADGMFPPSLSAAYDLRDARTYDPMVSTRWRALFDRLDPSVAGDRFTCIVVDPDPGWARLMGLQRYLVGATPSGFGWDGAPAFPTSPAQRVDGSTFRQTVACDAGRVADLVVVTGSGAPLSIGVDVDGRSAPIAESVALGRGIAQVRLAEPIRCPASIALTLSSATPTTVAGWPPSPAASPAEVDGKPVTLSLFVQLVRHHLPLARVDWLGGMAMLHLDGSRPFAWLPSRVLPARDESDALATAGRELASADAWAVIEAPAEPVAAAGSAGEVSFERPRPDEIELHTSTTSPRWLVVQESWDPGWHATIDGAATADVPADVAFQAIHVPAGAHAIRIDYAPGSFRLGLLITLLALVGLLALVIPT